MTTMQIHTTPGGAPCLVVDGVPLDDPSDPVAGARTFASSAPVKDGVRVVLLGVGLGYRAEALRARGLVNLVAWEPSPAVLGEARRLWPATLQTMPVFTDLAALARHLVEVSRSSEQTIMMAPPAYVAAFPGSDRQLVEVLQEVQGLVVIRENTLMERARAIVENALANLPRLASTPLATGLGRPLEGTPAFIVAAGPSLDGNAALLPEASRKGAVFAVNTSAPCVARAGARVDVLVAVENVDVSGAVISAAGAAHAVAFELASNTAVFGLDLPNRLAFVSAQPAFAEVCTFLGAAPLDYGASVATAAFALAHAWGADPIVLVGQDLAYTGGRVYASGTPYDGMIARRDGEELVLEGRPEKDEEYRRSGLTPQPRRKPRLEIPAWGGGMVQTTHELVLFLRWFEGAASRLAGGTRLVNATEGGAHITGFEERPLAALLADLPARSDDLGGVIAGARALGAERVEALRSHMATRARALAQAAARVPRAPAARKGKAHDEVRAAAKRAPLAELHASGELTRLLIDRDMSPAERTRRTFEIVRASAERVAALSAGENTP